MLPPPTTLAPPPTTDLPPPPPRLTMLRLEPMPLLTLTLLAEVVGRPLLLLLLPMPRRRDDDAAVAVTARVPLDRLELASSMLNRTEPTVVTTSSKL